MPPYPPNPHITIIGGSLAGLFCSVALLSLPNIASVTILERLPPSKLQDLGAGIRCGHEATKAILHYTGASPETYSALLHWIRFIDSDGSILVDQHREVGDWTSTWMQTWRVLKTRFDQDPRAKFRFGCALQSLEESSSPTIERPLVMVNFTNEDDHSETLHTDILIGADGPSSTVRALLLPTSSPRQYAGYVCYRGVIPESDLTPAATAMYSDAGTFHWAPSSQFVSYPVPHNDGHANEQNGRLINWVWYQNKTEDELHALLTDCEGVKHRFSLPPGGLREVEDRKIKQKAERDLPSQHGEIVGKTEKVFVQAVADSGAERCAFLGGKVLLVGDAVAGQRPHTASALMQGQFHTECLLKLLQGQVDLEQWEREVLEFSSILVTKGKELGWICMGDDEPQAKTKVFFGTFFGAQELLARKFAALSETANGVKDGMDQA